MRAHKTLLAMAAALLAALTLYACGGGGDRANSGAEMAGSAVVTGYVTDDLAGYESVVLTLKSVQLRHTSGRACEIIPEQPPTDVAELGRDQLVSLVDTTECEAGPYNRLFVELDDDVTLRETAASPTLACKFVSYFEGSFPLPNRLACNGDTCSLNITGAVNLIARNHEHVALDVDLKNFVVDEGPPCTVTLKVSPVHAANKLAAGYRIALSGTVSSVDSINDHFTLTARGKSFTVRYAGVTDQPGVDALLQLAAADQLRTTVRCQTLDRTTTPPVCTAQTAALQPLKAITVKAKGTISLLSLAAQTFTLSLGAGPTLVPVNFAKAADLGKVAGTLADGAVAGVKLYGFESAFYLAREVEVE